MYMDEMHYVGRQLSRRDSAQGILIFIPIAYSCLDITERVPLRCLRLRRGKSAIGLHGTYIA